MNQEIQHTPQGKISGAYEDKALTFATSLLENANDLVAAIDTDLRFVGLNAAFRREFELVFGRPVELGQRLDDALDHLTADRNKVATLCRRALAGESFRVIEEFGDRQLLRKTYEMALSPILDTRGQPLMAAIVVRDLTMQRLAEQRFGALLEAAPDAMIIVRTDGMIDLTNALAERMFQFERRQLIGRPVEMLLPERLRGGHVGHRRHFIEEGKARPMGSGRTDLLGLRSDGSEFPVEISLNPLNVGGEKMVVAAIRDMTVRQRAEDRLRELSAELEQRVAESTAALERANDVYRNSEAHFHIEGRGGGADDYLAKPLPARELLARVASRLKLARARRDGLDRERDLRAEIVDILESMNNIFFAFDADWRITYVNAAAERAISMPRDSLLGKNYWEVFPAALGSVAEREFRRAMAQRVEVKFEIFYESYGQWFEVNAFPVKNGGLAEYASNITERKQGEQATLQLAAIVTSSDDAIISKTLDGTIVSWNAGASRMYGYSEDEMLGRSISTLVPPEQPDDTRDILERIRRGERVEHHETVRLCKDGRRVDVSLRVSPILDLGGGVTGAAAIARDISERKRAEQALRESEQKYRLLWETTTDAVILMDPETGIRFANPSVVEVFGYSPEALIGQKVAILQPERLREAHIHGLRRYLETGVKKLDWRHTEMIALHRDGHEFPVEISFSHIESGGTPLFAGFIRDISARKLAEEALREREAQIRRLVDANIVGVLFWHICGAITDANDAFLQLSGYSREDLLSGKIRWQDITQPKYRAADDLALGELLQTGSCKPSEREYIRKDGGHVPVLVGHAMFKGSREQGVSFVLDLSERKQAEEQVRHMANHDALTGLPNRALLQDRLHQAIAYANRNQGRVAILFIDLDHFKNINDSLGHHIGDVMLQMAATRLQKCLREGDSVARLGGDEFVLSLSLPNDSGDAARVAQKALDALALPFVVEGHDLHISASIGISLYPDDGDDVETLMRTADTAMYHAKETGRGNFQFFTDELNQVAQRRLDVGARLRHALVHDEFILHYQPQVEMGDGAIFSVEALLRWQTPGSDPISCGDFITNAEESGLIVPIGEWALREACRQLKIWHDAGRPELKMAVNLSPRQLEQANFCSVVGQILMETGIPASALELEITESILLQRSEFNLATLTQLSEMGIQLSVDDFGTGYSSLAYLQRFPVHALKIDQSFVRDIGRDPNDTALITAIIAMANSLRLNVVAEGVETSQQARFLLAHGCHAGQGFYFSKAVPAEALSALFGTKSNLRPSPHA